MSLNLTTYNPDKEYSGFYFFILNKGLNSGKPLKNPCPNCFILKCQSDEVKQELFWLTFSLWQGKVFRPHLIGSVIPYIRIKDLTNVLKHGIEKLTINPEKVKNHITTLIKMEDHRIRILKQNQLIQQLKQSLITQILK